MRVLKNAQLEICFDVVKTPEEFVTRLRTAAYDIILADYALGQWTGVDALNLLREEGQDIPFILVTGALGEEKAVECIKIGMADYILKDRLTRLPVAILRALEEKASREERQRAEGLLQDSEVKFRTLAEALPSATFVEQDTCCHYVNRAAECITGYSREELLTMNFWQLVHPDSRKMIIDQAPERFDDEQPAPRYEIKILTKNNEVRWLDVTVTMFQLDGRLAALITAFDTFGRKRQEEGDIRQLVGRLLVRLHSAEISQNQCSLTPCM
jgi:two-component system cell cycle sensor histidine kinase/response regulator CckA